MELDDFTTRSLAVEPELERWIYAVENVLGGVVVILAALAAYRFSQGGLGSEGGRAEERATDHAT